MKYIRTAIIIVVVLAIAWFAFGRNQVERMRFYGFDQDGWANASESQRYFMAKYLVAEKVLIGKTKDEISNLLGEASSETIGMALYNLGPERGSLFAVDDDWLEITFDGTPDHLRVTSTRIRPD